MRASIAATTVWILANLTVLMLVAFAWADRYNPSNSATLVEDGALLTVVVVLALVILNGLILCLRPHTQRLGYGALLGGVLAVPVALVTVIGFLSTHLT